MFCKKVVLKIRLFARNSIYKKLRHRLFFCEFNEVLDNNFLTESLWVTFFGTLTRIRCFYFSELCLKRFGDDLSIYMQNLHPDVNILPSVVAINSGHKNENIGFLDCHVTSSWSCDQGVI